jgi:elongation factor G
MDYLEEEQQRGITITSAATTCLWGDYTVNLIDTPGHVDFTIEVERSLRVLDGAVVVFCAVGGVEAQSETVWRQADRYHVPRLCFINKMDRLGADFDAAVEEIRERLGARPVPIQLPIGSSADFAGHLDLIDRTATYYHQTEVAADKVVRPLTDEQSEVVEPARRRMIEAIAEADDGLMGKYVEEEEIGVEDIRAALRRATIASRIQPVLCGSALKHVGVRSLLDAVCEYLPSPREVPPVAGHDPSDLEKVLRRPPKEEEPFAALVFKIISDPHGDLYFIRCYSGTLDLGKRIYNPARDKKEVVSRIWEMYAKQRIRREQVGPGDIVALVGPRHSLTGDTLCDPKEPILLEKMEFPEPVISMSIEPRSGGDRDRLIDSLGILEREDPTFRWSGSRDTGQLLISGMGELHLEVLKNKLVHEVGLDVKVGRPRVAYRETVTHEAEGQGRFERQIGGKNQFAAVTLRVTPAAESGAEGRLTFVNEASGEQVPEPFVAAVEEGIRDAATSGPLAGYPLANLSVTLTGGQFRENESTEVAYSQAGAAALNEAVEQAGPAFLEPIMRVEVTVPETYLGAVTGDLTSRRGEITGMETRGELRKLTGKAPLAEMFGYTTALRSLTQGRGTSSLEPLTYDVVPAEVAARLS